MIDPVRAITNSATGQSGHILATMAAGFNAHVTLIRNQTHPIPSMVDTQSIQSSQDLLHRCKQMISKTDVFIMNAAVSDFTITPFHTKQSRQSELSLTLTPTIDILATINQIKPSGCVSVGYCLTDTVNLSVAKQKMIQKGCDVMIANGVDNIGNPKRTIHYIDQNHQAHPISGCVEQVSHAILKHLHTTLTGR